MTYWKPLFGILSVTKTILRKQFQKEEYKNENLKFKIETIKMNSNHIKIIITPNILIEDVRYLTKTIISLNPSIFFDDHLLNMITSRCFDITIIL